jgi:hypothetical protein
MAPRCRRAPDECEAQVAGEGARRGKPLHIADPGDERGRGQPADAGDRTQLVDGQARGGRSLQLTFDDAEPALEFADLLDGRGERRPEQPGDTGVGVLEQRPHVGHDLTGADGDHDPEF